MVSSLWITPGQVQLTVLPSLPPADRWRGALCPSDHSRGSWPVRTPPPHASRGPDPLTQPPGFSSLLTLPKRNQETWLDPLCRRFRAIPPGAPPSPGQAAASLSSGFSSQSSPNPDCPRPRECHRCLSCWPWQAWLSMFSGITSAQRPRESSCRAGALQSRVATLLPAASPTPHTVSLEASEAQEGCHAQVLSAIVHSASPGGEGLSLLLPRTACPLRVMESPEHNHPVTGEALC